MKAEPHKNKMNDADTPRGIKEILGSVFVLELGLTNEQALDVIWAVENDPDTFITDFTSWGNYNLLKNHIESLPVT
jgi:hypothetical protein